MTRRTCVVHCNKARYDVYIGRPSKWGNRFSHVPSLVPGTVRVATREEAICREEARIRSNPRLMRAIKRELKGKVLG